MLFNVFATSEINFYGTCRKCSTSFLFETSFQSCQTFNGIFHTSPIRSHTFQGVLQKSILAGGGIYVSPRGIFWILTRRCHVSVNTKSMGLAVVEVCHPILDDQRVIMQFLHSKTKYYIIFQKSVFNFMANIILGTQIPCTQNRYTAFNINLKKPLLSQTTDRVSYWLFT